MDGESGGVRGETMSSWKEQLPEIVAGYEAKDGWNFNEAGCFGEHCLKRNLERKARNVERKKAKQRVTIAFLVNATGESEGKPIVI